MSELKQCGACPGCAEQCRHEAENPPAPGAEPEVLAFLDAEGDVMDAESGSLFAAKYPGYTALVDRTHVANLQAQLETASNFNREQGEDVARLQAEASQLHQHKSDYMEAAEETRKALQAEARQLRALLELARGALGENQWTLLARDIDAALAEGAKS